MNIISLIKRLLQLSTPNTTANRFICNLKQPVLYLNPNAKSFVHTDTTFCANSYDLRNDTQTNTTTCNTYIPNADKQVKEMILAPVRLDTNHDKNNPDMSIISDTSILNRGCDISTVNSKVSPTSLSPSNDNHILLSRVGSANPISPEITHCACPEREGASLVSQNILNIDMDNITDSISHSQDIHASPNVSTSESQDSLLPGSS